MLLEVKTPMYLFVIVAGEREEIQPITPWLQHPKYIPTWVRYLFCLVPTKDQKKKKKKKPEGMYTKL